MITWGQVAGSLALVGVAVALSIWRRLPLERDIGWAVLRAFVQLLALGYVIKAIFDAGGVAYALPVLLVMVVFGALTARNRAPGVPHAFPILLLSIGVALVAWLAVRDRDPSHPVRRRETAECLGLYWNFVDAVWIFLYPLFYLVSLAP